MGYRVGFQCFDTAEAATDYKMSQVVPHINTHGQLVYPIKQSNGQWAYAGHTVQLSHGYCNPMEDFKAGATISGAFASVLLVVFVYRTAKSVLDRLFYERDESD